MTKYKIIKFYRIFFILYGSVYISKAICLLATAPFCPIHIIFTVHYVVPILYFALLYCSVTKKVIFDVNYSTLL